MRTPRDSARVPVGRVTSGSIEQRFGERVVIIDGCWAFNGDLTRYGQARAMQGMPGHFAKQERAHRVAYQILVGPIPEGHQLHHTCGNKGCVNPAHLEPMTPADHARHHDNLASRR